MFNLLLQFGVERDGKYFLDIKQSKGGRDRLAPILPSKVDEVKQIFERARESGKTKLFEHIPKEIDIHGSWILVKRDDAVWLSLRKKRINTSD